MCHLLYVYDALVFCEANLNHLRCLRVLFLCFEAASGLKMNLDKSKLVLVGHVDNVTRLADILEYKVSFLPRKYLGLPLGASLKEKSIWDGVIEKTEQRLAGCKLMYSSKGAISNLLHILCLSFRSLWSG